MTFKHLELGVLKALPCDCLRQSKEVSDASLMEWKSSWFDGILSVSLPAPPRHTHTLCVRYHSSSLWFLVLSSGCFWTPHPWPSSLYKRNLLLLLCASQKSSVDRKGLKGGPGQWGGVLEQTRVTNRRLAKNIWEIFQSYWSYGMKAKLHFCIKKWGPISSQFF